MSRVTYSVTKMKKKNKPKVIYKEDNGETIYSMAALEGLTPEQAEERDKERKKRVKISRKERRAMIFAAYGIYGKILLIVLLAFSIAAILMYLLMR